MQLNIRKLDERIQKLQEIRRIAADPELLDMLMEFMANEDEREKTSLAAKAHAAGAGRADDMEIVNQVMKGLDPRETVISGKR